MCHSGMDKVLVKQLNSIRRQISKEDLKEGLKVAVSPSIAPVLLGSIEGVSETRMVDQVDEQLPVVQIVPMSLKPHSVEADMYLSLVTIVYLLDRKRLAEAMTVTENVLLPLLSAKPTTHHNNSSMDALIAKAYFYFVRVYEVNGRVGETRSILMAAYTSACVHHFSVRQAVLINLILRCFYIQGLVDQGQKFASKIEFPETRSNAEFARYLFYMGIIRAVQLQYSEAHSFLSQAIRKAPSTVATGFRLAATKANIVVELLMGEVPDRSVFKGTELRPYFLIAQSVRKGDVSEFTKVVAEYESVFIGDRLISLIRRLHQNVIKAGLRSITSSYSRILLSDVAVKLGLASVNEATDVAAKAIVDGVIEARINYDNNSLESSWGADIYSTNEPSKQLHKRIAFCLQLYTDAIKAMQYPDVNEIEKELMETNEEILRAQKMDLEEGLDDDDDMML